jgi:hypothetical protein
MEDVLGHPARRAILAPLLLVSAERRRALEQGPWGREGVRKGLDPGRGHGAGEAAMVGVVAGGGA